LGSLFGFIVMGALIGILFTRAGWARIVTLVIVGYVGAVGLLVSLFARGDSSVVGFVAALIALAVFWLLLRPGMSQYFNSGAAPGPSRVIPVAPRPGALPHLQHNATSGPVARVTTQTAPAVNAGSTQEQWARLQQQLRVEQIREEREAASAESAAHRTEAPYPWLATIFAVLIFAYASSVGGDIGKASMLLVIPGFIVAMVRWINPQEFLLGVLALSGFLIVRPEWKMVAPEIGSLLQHHGPMVFAGVVLLGYIVALCGSGLADNCEEAA
jgi:hypothetical protein